jgi:hypothetical protein
MPVSVGYLTSGTYATFSAQFLAGLATINNAAGSPWNGSPGGNVTIIPGEAAGSYDAKGTKQALNRQVVRLCNEPDVKIIVAVGGLVSAFAAAKHSTKPFLIMIGQLPASDDFDLDPENDFNYCGGINLNTTVANSIRHDAAASLAGCAPAEVFLLINNNARMAKAERRAWKAQGWPSIAGGVDEDGDNDTAEFKSAIKKAMKKGAKAIVVSADPFFALNRDRLVAAIHDSTLSPLLYACYPSSYFAGATPAPTPGRFRWVGPDLGTQYRNIGAKTGVLLNKVLAGTPEFIGLDTAVGGIGPGPFAFANLII